MNIFSIRGATTIEENTEAEITAKSIELIDTIYKRNNLSKHSSSVINIVISTTSDITKAYPAKAIRENGYIAPLFSTLEPPIDNALSLCIRILITAFSQEHIAHEPRHVYLHDAVKLRPDLVK